MSPARHLAEENQALLKSFTFRSIEIHDPIGTVPHMSPGPVVAPPGVFAVVGEDVEFIARWAQAQSTGLTTLVSQLHALSAEADAAKQDLEVLPEKPSPVPPAAFLASIDAMLQAGRAEIEGKLREAQTEASSAVATATMRAWHLLKSTGVGAGALTRVMAVEWVPMQYTSEPGKSATDLWQSLVGGKRESDEPGAAAMSTEAPPDPLGSRIKPDMVKLDAFLSHPAACGGVFDSRQTFWGELYEQQGFSRLRRYARSGA